MIKYLYTNNDTFSIDINTNEIGLGITYSRFIELNFWLIVIHVFCLHFTISSQTNK